MNALSPALLLASSSLSSFSGDDAALRAACSRFTDVEAALYALPNSAPDLESREALDRYHDAYSAVEAGRLPTTITGLQALARVVMSGLHMQAPEEEAEWHILGVWHLLRAVLALDTAERSPDAAMIAVCAEYLRIQRAFEAYFNTLPDDTDMADDDPACKMLDPVPALVEQIVSARPVTAEGYMARARCAAFWFLPQHEICQDNPDGAAIDRFLAAGMRDLVAMERGGSGQEPPEAPAGMAVTAAPPRPNDELLERYSAWLEAERLALTQEMYPGVDPREAARYVPACVYSRQVTLGRCPSPSTRAQALLETAGIWTGPDTSEARRAVLDGQWSGAKGVVTTTIPAPEPDDALVAAVDAFFMSRAQRPVSVGQEKVFGTPECERFEASLEPLFAVESDLFQAAVALPARTMTGLQAKARLVKAWDEHEDHVDALLNDLLGSAVR